jgi:hypothetical protein
MMEAYERPYKPVPDSLLDDWTGHRFGKYAMTYGEEVPVPPVAQVLDENGYSKGVRFFKEKEPEAKPDEESSDSTFVQAAPAQSLSEAEREWHFNLGDMQEHKYGK